MTAKEKLASMVGQESAERYVGTIKAMLEVDDFDAQEQVEEKILSE
jgi:hypothetical protein